jgi:tetratricopeptide (TPR) repeat protein
MLRRSKDAEPWEILGIESSRECNEGGVARKFRELSQRFHPDRYSGESKRTNQIAAEVFSLVSDAQEALLVPGVLAEVEQILIAKEEGRVYVSRADRQRARLAFKKAEVLFRQKRLEPALAQIADAQELDPTDWRFDSLRIQVSQRLGKMEAEDAAQALVDLDGPKGKERAMVLYNAAELLMRGGQEERAYKLFDEVLELDESHIGAKRRLRLKGMRGG